MSGIKWATLDSHAVMSWLCAVTTLAVFSCELDMKHIWAVFHVQTVGFNEYILSHEISSGKLLPLFANFADCHCSRWIFFFTKWLLCKQLKPQRFNFFISSLKMYAIKKKKLWHKNLRNIHHIFHEEWWNSKCEIAISYTSWQCRTYCSWC